MGNLLITLLIIPFSGITMWIFLKYKNGGLINLPTPLTYIYLLLINPVISLLIAFFPTMYWYFTLMGTDTQTGAIFLIVPRYIDNPELNKAIFNTFGPIFSLFMFIPYILIALALSILVKSSVKLKILSSLIGITVYFLFTYFIIGFLR